MQASLAPFKYRHAFEKDGGPIAKLAVGPAHPIQGRPAFCATASLSQSLKPVSTPKMQIYGNVDGCGTHPLRGTACYIAISEALESWAFFTEFHGPRKASLGLDVEPSTTGMAAFPGITKGPARKHAFLEAAERWSIIEWWQGKLPAIRIASDGRRHGILEIKMPFHNCFTVIVWKEAPFGGLTYGFACGISRRHAVMRASIEQERNVNVLTKLFSDKSSSPDDFKIDSLRIVNEQRLVFFASSAGASLFLKRVEESCSLQTPALTPQKVIDREIDGPWTRYATVWRVLFGQSSLQHLEARKDFFLF